MYGHLAYDQQGDGRKVQLEDGREGKRKKKYPQTKLLGKKV
jgi:hypothetical protein